MSILEARGICVSYGAVRAVRDVDVHVDAGEVVALLGANGAGKTSLLSAIAGQVRSQGSVKLGGVACDGPAHRRARRGLAFVGDDRCLFPSLTVRQSMQLVRATTSDVADQFPHLATIASRRAGLCSGGEQQMLALARALASGPTVIVVDELSLGLAPRLRDELLGVLREVAAAGVAVLIVEQHVEAVLDVSDRAYLLHRGEVVDHQPATSWRGRSSDLLERILR